ncbi:unnamed protein product [Cuscuta europaea]|uniref:Uncharacterized protein n=1 Tax=Cuscuta europaea TaxID=41803 RepID=A0A9P1EGL2_CUSEU|nr:unnamed protein product [Cuscuta europaea]
MPVTKILPISSRAQAEASIRNDSSKPITKSRFKRLFDRPFPSVLRNSSAAEKLSAAHVPGGELLHGKEGFSAVVAEYEPSSVCLTKMVHNFMEESNEKLPPKAVKCGRNRCNCFNGKGDDSSDDDFDFTTFGSLANSSDSLKSLVLCATVSERNILADASKIVDKNKTFKCNKEESRKIVAKGLLSLGYTASICKSKWESTCSIPAGEYEFIDVIVEGERVFVDLDFRSQFEIARSTGGYKAILQLLPFIFIGKTDRLLQIVSIVSEAGNMSLKKKGMHIAPWRKAEYMKAKWLSPCSRTSPPEAEAERIAIEIEAGAETEGDELDIIFGDKATCLCTNKIMPLSVSPPPEKWDVVKWQPPERKPKGSEKANKIVVTGLTALLKDKYCKLPSSRE